MQHTRKLQIIKVLNVLTPYLYINCGMSFATICTFYQFIVKTFCKTNYKSISLKSRYQLKLWTKFIYKKPSSFRPVNTLCVVTRYLVTNTNLVVRQWSIGTTNHTLILRSEFFKFLTVGLNIELWQYYILYYRNYLLFMNTWSLYLIYSLLKSNILVNKTLKSVSTFKTLFVLNLKNL